ncbi:MAG: Fe-S oxidoreductase [Elusimicrobia bacterium]|nr:MAG: Fe-S oxidoreductase [Elusimicrobiota bacterium]
MSPAAGASFSDALASAGRPALKPGALTVLQVNVGKFCNMTCAHCHVDAGPHRTAEVMTKATMEACLRVLDAAKAEVVDVTGGAPELNPHFRWLVDECRARGARVLDRCNLTVLLTPGREDLPEWFAAREVEVVASLPHYRRRNTDLQRGDGTFEKSLTALRRLNAAGYGTGDPRRRLSLVCNPVGAFLAPPQAEAEAEWKRGLKENHGLAFDRLIAINNMPISRYLDWLEASGNLESYMALLTNAFNPATLDGLMCRNTLSVSWDGRLYDCDFNQMLELESRPPRRSARVEDFDAAAFAARDIVVGRHCFGCTAGAGSSCGGALA